MPSESESNAVSHCSFACRTCSKKRAFAITIAACVATVESSRTSSGGNAPSRGSAITSVPTSAPWARSGTAAAEPTASPATSVVGAPLGSRTSSSRSLVSERATSPASSDPMARRANGARTPSAAATWSMLRPDSPPSPSSASASSAPRASRNRIV